MRHLCDAQVFLAMVLDAHAHHQRARRWFEELTENDTAEFCRVTQISFMRLLTTEAVCRRHTLTNRRAISVYRRLCGDSNVGFCAEPQGMEQAWLREASVSKPSPKLWNDAYLAALAKLNNMRLVSFDRGFRSFRGLNLLLLRPNP